MHILDSNAVRLPNHVLPPGHIVHVFKLLGAPGCEQTCRQRVMAVAHHAGDGKVNSSARLHIRKKPLPQIVRVAPEIVIRVDAHHGIEEPRLERQAFRGVGLDGMNPFVRHAHLSKERAILIGIAPQVDGVHVEPVFAREHHARYAGARAEVAHTRPLRDIRIAK